MMASIKDVADAAGVSIATVSRVLTDKPHVSEELRQRVMTAVQSLGYRPNRIARSLRTQQSATIGLVVSDIRNPYFTAVSRVVEDLAYQNGMSVYLCNTDENPDKEEMYLSVLRNENVAGIIFSPTRKTAEKFSQLNLDIPTIAIDRPIPSDQVDSVLIDNQAAAFRLAEHLISNGFRRIGALFGSASSTGRERRLGFEQALNAHGLPVHPDLVRYVPAKVQAGHQAALEMLDTHAPLQAFYTSNGLLLAGALMAIRDRNLRIPEQVGLAGFDDVNWTVLVQPAITVIAQPTDEIGRTATELLLQRIENPQRPARQVILQSQLLVRESSLPSRHQVGLSS
jgi:LacI family transcriptional regulator, fructose operon transcriptional repressor